MNPTQTIFCLLTAFLFSCNFGQKEAPSDRGTIKPGLSDIELFRNENPNDSLVSKSIGSVSSGKLIHGKLLPFSGTNFRYFDTASYCNGMAFVHEAVRSTLIETYEILDSLYPQRQFVVMECSKKNGGPVPLHRTHQNGLSVDFMSPLTRGGKPYYGLDSMGIGHYLLSFKDDGTYPSDTSIRIDFDLIGHHILLLNRSAKKHGLKIAKVIIKTELKDDLKRTPHGARIASEGIYVVRSLTHWVNNMHDDHYHIDFKPIN